MENEDFKAENLHQVIGDNDDIISRIVQKVEDDPFRYF